MKGDTMSLQGPLNAVHGFRILNGINLPHLRLFFVHSREEVTYVQTR
jgi:hypothetical protein